MRLGRESRDEGEEMGCTSDHHVWSEDAGCGYADARFCDAVGGAEGGENHCDGAAHRAEEGLCVWSD